MHQRLIDRASNWTRLTAACTSYCQGRRDDVPQPPPSTPLTAEQLCEGWTDGSPSTAAIDARPARPPALRAMSRLYSARQPSDVGLRCSPANGGPAGGRNRKGFKRRFVRPRHGFDGEIGQKDGTDGRRGRGRAEI